MKKVWNVVVRFVEHRAGVMNHAPTRTVGVAFMRPVRNQRGATLIMVAISMVVIFGFAVLAIDVSMMLLARTQLKNAADSAALAGASALVDGDAAAATEQAIKFAGLNVAVQETLSPVIITPEDITFPVENTIQVRTHRTRIGETDERVSLFFLRVINSASDNKDSVTATSRASVSQVCATDCVKPWAPSDRWDDTDSDGVYDTNEFYDPWLTGYRYPDDIGTQVTLKLRNSSKFPIAGWYYVIDYPPINKGTPLTGANWYREWIGGCEPYIIEVGDNVQIEPGNMVGPTNQGLDSLISLDPSAEWDAGTGKVINSSFAVSPRIIRACLFDPTIGLKDFGAGRKYMTIVKIMVLFIEGHSGGDLTGRFMRMASQGENCDDPGSFMYKVALMPGPEEE